MSKITRVPKELIPFLDALAEMLASQIMAEESGGRGGTHGQAPPCQSQEKERKATVATCSKQHVTL